MRVASVVVESGMSGFIGGVTRVTKTGTENVRQNLCNRSHQENLIYSLVLLGDETREINEEQ